MRKTIFGGFVLAACLAVLVAAPDATQAQKSKEKETKATVSTAGVIEIGEGKDGKFRFFVRDGDGKLVAMSSPGGFKSAKDAEVGIEHLKAIVSKAKVTTAKKKKDKTKE